MIELPLDSQFKLEKFRRTASQLSEAEARSQCVQVYEQMMLQENYYKGLLRQRWGMEPK